MPLSGPLLCSWPHHTAGPALQGHQRLLEGHSQHPHSSCERMLAVGDGSQPVAGVLGCADSRAPVELLQDGAQHSLEDCCRRYSLVLDAILVNPSVLFADRLRVGMLELVAGYDDLLRSAIHWPGHVQRISYKVTT